MNAFITSVIVFILITSGVLVFNNSSVTTLNNVPDNNSLPKQDLPSKNIEKGGCGDGACDQVEKSSGKCPEDCGQTSTNTCGNNTCDAGETIKTCPSDCKTNTSTEVIKLSVDYSANLGKFSNYIFGIPSPPYYDAKEYSGAKTAGFITVELTVPEYKDGSSVDYNMFDKQMAGIVGNGLEPKLMFPISEIKPTNSSGYKSYVKIILQRAKDKWPGAVKSLRFANEPDNNGFWKGTETEFFEYYKMFIEAVDSFDSNLLVDAPGLMMGTKRAETIAGINSSGSYSSTSISDPGGLSNFGKKFLDYCKTNKIRVDYFSTHGYSFFPYRTYYEDTKALKSALASYKGVGTNGAEPKLSNNEWSFFLGNVWSGTYTKDFDTAWSATSNIMNISNMIESGIEMSTKLGGITNNVSNSGCNDFPLYDCNGNPKPGYYAFKAFNQLQNSDRVLATGTDRMNTTIIAGKKNGELIIVIGNYDAKAYLARFKGVETNDKFKKIAEDEVSSTIEKIGSLKVYGKSEITLKNLPSTMTKYEQYTIDDLSNMTLTKSGSVSNGKINIDLTLPSVQLIKVK